MNTGNYSLFVPGTIIGVKGSDNQEQSKKSVLSIEAFCLTLPGQELHLPSLLVAKKFRNRGNKDGALTAFHQLANDGLGKLEGNNPVLYVYTFQSCYHKCRIRSTSHSCM